MVGVWFACVLCSVLSWYVECLCVGDAFCFDVLECVFVF